ncbi:MAG TPA: hypothetical protein VFX60_08760 [Micromonospora sp.]|nr:hypothetical protein [Micromonospora sp.]
MLIVAGAVAAFLLVGTGIAIGEAIGSPSNSSGNDAAAPESPFPAAKKKCAPSSDHAHLGDEGKSLTLAGQGEKSAGLPYTVITCVLEAVKIPDAVIAQMDSTRALDGRQTAEWNDIQASWTYHPNSGLKVILTFSGSASKK